MQQDILKQASINKGRRTVEKKAETRSTLGSTAPRIYVELKHIDATIVNFFNEYLKIAVTTDGKSHIVKCIPSDPDRMARMKSAARDQKDIQQLPIITVQRTNVQRDDRTSSVNKQLEYIVKTPNTKNYRFDNFSALNGIRPAKEYYIVKMPDYVTIAYSGKIKTRKESHMNKIIETILFAEQSYWGELNGYKFHVNIASFDMSKSSGDTDEKVREGTFNIEVKAYMLPEDFAGKPTSKKMFTKSAIRFIPEVVLNMISPHKRVKPTVSEPQFSTFRYWGTLATDTISGNALSTFDREPSDTRVQVKTITGAGNYIYFAWEPQFGEPVFYINGFLDTSWVKITDPGETFIVLNDHNTIPKNFHVYRSATIHFGTIEIVIN